MLSEVNVVGKWFQDEPDEGWRFDEIKFGDEAKQVFKQLDLNIEMYDHSARVSGDKNHTYIPGHYFLYAIKIRPLVDLLSRYMEIFGKVTKSVSATEFHDLITSHDPKNSVLGTLDVYSKDNFVKVFKNKSDRLNGKDIINAQGETDKKFRSDSDFFRSILLKAMPVRDVSSDMLGQLIYAFHESPEAYEYLIKHYSSSVPHLLLAKKGDELLFMIMSILGWNNKFDELYTSVSGDMVDWDGISNAFLLSHIPVAGNSSYVEKPVHYHSVQKKYVFIKKGLLDSDTGFDHISKLISELWKNVVVEKDADKFYLRSSGRKSAVTEKVKGGLNKIIYGAPGTGKSHSIKELTDQDGARKVITVFHPDTQYSDFVGSLKPHTERESGSPVITYKYRPGPFVKALIEAENNPSDKVYLVIEEINRAPAAAVFGEIFQLLDRDEDGSSQYSIEVSDPDMLEYLKLNISGDIKDLRIPSNLYIYATMNSSDQAVMPLDTAFKRRWSFEYISLNFSEAPDQQLELMTSDGLYHISWKSFADSVVNRMLKEFRVAEDRLIGPFFLDKAELKKWETALSGKLFVYLWDDVLRHKHQDRKRLFKEDITTYGDLFAGFSTDKPVFADETDQLIRVHGTKADSE
ncbi:McrB family protein [Vibrio parahaemolyticus]|uniref:McrB family protein n=1 Tax=Vibrio parahaemolyticus TaxID=670 RepID=UPI002879D37D|nr:AAA family ATPase [Vibrio parahaemolyticus]MDS1866223.1 AAA family ATPase [Vibrio parahaemolyticus]HCG7061671.1 AAA family ATPase [Vibrio parahaemolyticus]HCG7063255.1 AAA family ATPase [Vibrio parahaemolyticus]HCG8081955.1 AAA family ATPase [Vibrio parahaemolyticus]HCG8085079.1 AAA family ATPase [Vibrio parahaemolyticus]